MDVLLIMSVYPCGTLPQNQGNTPDSLFISENDIKFSPLIDLMLVWLLILDLDD
jgi:hypothetical protein